MECRAWTGLAEVGLRIIDSGFTTSGEHAWANGIEEEVSDLLVGFFVRLYVILHKVEKAIGKGVRLKSCLLSVKADSTTFTATHCSKGEKPAHTVKLLVGSLISFQHPSLRLFRHHLSLLNAQFAFQSNNTKYARALLRRLIASFMSSDPPSVVYTAHLALITHLTSPPLPAVGASNYAVPSTPELQAALTSITTLSALAAQNKHTAIEDLTAVLRVRVLVGAGLWDLVDDALSVAETAMQIVFPVGEGRLREADKAKPDTAEALMRSHSITAQDVHSSTSSQSQSQPNDDPIPPPLPAKEASPIPGPKATDTLTLALTAHLLILGVIFHTHGGRARAADARLAALHSLMDSGALAGGADLNGLVEVCLMFVSQTISIDFNFRYLSLGAIPSFYKQLTHTYCSYLHFLSLLSRSGIQSPAVPRSGFFQSAG